MASSLPTGESWCGRAKLAKARHGRLGTAWFGGGRVRSGQARSGEARAGGIMPPAFIMREASRQQLRRPPPPSPRDPAGRPAPAATGHGPAQLSPRAPPPPLALAPGAWRLHPQAASKLSGAAPACKPSPSQSHRGVPQDSSGPKAAARLISVLCAPPTLSLAPRARPTPSVSPR